MKPVKHIKQDNVFLLSLAGVKLLMHVLVNAFGGYGMFRDEFYYLACADHLAWGYVDQPPLSIAVLAGWTSMFGDSLFSIRILPALCGATVVFLTGKMVQELGGNRFAQGLAAVAIIVAPGFLGLHGFYSMNAFDFLFWALLIYLVIKIIKTENSKLWLLFGLVAGLGLQNKISVLFLLFGLGVGILLTPHRRWLREKFLWLGAALAVLLFLPHIVWQMHHDWPTVEFMSFAATYKNVSLSPVQFFMEQIFNMNPVTVWIWFGGLVALLFHKNLQRYRLFAIAYIAIFIVFVIQNGKPYYLFPSYPVLFAGGAVVFGALFSRPYVRWLKPVTLFLLIVFGVFLAPMALPILPVQQFLRYSSAIGFTPSAGETHKMGALPQHFADMHGWEEMVAEIAQVYHSLPDSEKVVASIYVQNYGEAGAIDYYRDQYNLPPALCGHNNYYLWGLRGQTGEVMIIFGGRQQDHEQVYESVEMVTRFSHPYVMPYENNQPIYICRGLKMPLNEVYPRTKHFG